MTRLFLSPVSCFTFSLENARTDNMIFSTGSAKNEMDEREREVESIIHRTDRRGKERDRLSSLSTHFFFLITRSADRRVASNGSGLNESPPVIHTEMPDVPGVG